MSNKFSIIIPTMNSQRYLVKCLESVEKQDYENYEIIIIDKNSTDKTLEIISKFKKTNKRIFLYRQKSNGLSNAMNEGIKKVKGDLILILGSDDLIIKNTFKIVNNVFNKNKKIKWCVGGFHIVNEKEKILKSKFHKKLDYLSLFFHDYLCHQSMYIKKEVYNEIGNYKGTLSMDFDMTLRIWKKFGKPYLIKKYLSKFRFDYTNISSKHGIKQVNEKITIIKKHIDNRFLFLFSFLFNKLVIIKKILFKLK